MDKKFRISVRHVLREIAGEYIAIPLGTGENESQIVVLNSVSKFLWEKLQNEITLTELVDALMSEFEGVTREEAENDTKEFIFQLVSAGFLE